MQGLQMAFDQQRNADTVNVKLTVKMAQYFNTMVKEIFMKHLKLPYDEIEVLQIEKENVDDKD
jgi:DNA-binding XRE family transcriptional regulator